MGLKHLREHNKDFNINLVDLISNLDPTKTKKITPFLISVLKKEIESRGTPEYFGNQESDVSKIINNIDSPIQKSLLYYIIDIFYGFNNIATLEKFSDYLDRGLIEKNDISVYKNFSDMDIEISKAITKDLTMKSKKEVRTVYESEDWWMFKPLSHEASVQYGYGAKWCTSMRDEPEYFYRHSKNGVLIYAINKKNNRKFGCHKHIGETVRFWDESDQQIDSFETGMGWEDVKEIFVSMNLSGPNYWLFSEEERKKSDKILSNGPRIGRFMPQPVLMVNNPVEISSDIPLEERIEDTLSIFQDMETEESNNIMGNGGIDIDRIVKATWPIKFSEEYPDLP